MVLIGDIVGDDDDAVARAACEVVRIANARGGEGFVAVSAEARKKFWLDRKRTAAIARHTNAFKINEDVVIPLPRMGDYTDGIERINIELSICATSSRCCDALDEFFAAASCRWARATTPARCPSAELLERPRAAGAGSCCARCARAGSWLARRLDAAQADAATRVFRAAAGPQPARVVEDRRCAQPLQQHLRRRRLRADPGRDADAHPQARCCSGRVWVALHMHAGDGNVHTNIPVNCDNYEMLQTAHEAVARIMALARSAGRRDLGRARHRHHQARVPEPTTSSQRFADYKARSRPRGPLQQGQAAAPARRRRCRPT